MFHRHVFSETSAVWKCEYKKFVIKRVDGFQEIISVALDFKLSPCSECCILSFGWFPGFWILCVDVSEHCSIFIGDVRIRPAHTAYEVRTKCSETSAHKIQTPGNSPKERIQQSVVFLLDVTLSVTRTDTMLHRRAVRYNDLTEYEYYFR
jgi:hypothetical protein